MLRNEIPVDVGDGINHFFISQASWQDPSLFLHHWGKPVFILLSSPFAQFGLNGVVIFNILVFAATVLLGYKFMDKMNVSIWLQLLFPLVLLQPVDYSGTILGGMTEPLFNLALVLSLLLLIKKQFLLFALIVSFMPFMRSEGQLPLILALVLLIYYRSYKSIPWLFTGFIIYSLLGMLTKGGFLWYFTESPYQMANGIYGKGNWDHYILSYKNYLGNPGMYLLMIAIPASVYFLIKRKWKVLRMDLLLFAAGIFFGVLISHSYFWATGQNGSMGLTRLGTQGMPLVMLMSLSYIQHVSIFSSRVGQSIFGLFAFVMCYTMLTSKRYPVKAEPLDKCTLMAANYLKSQDLENKKVFFFSPLLMYSCGVNPYFKEQHTYQIYICRNLKYDLGKLIQPGDLIVRDSHFGPLEMNIPLDKIKSIPTLKIQKSFISSEQLDDPSGETEGVFIYMLDPISDQR
jgi:hypothetical protein